MRRKLCLLWVCLCASLCSCQRSVSENEVGVEITFLDKYNEIFVKENAKRAALIYLDEDAIPELLLLKNGEYRVYTFDGKDVKAVNTPDTNIKMKAYGPSHILENYDDGQKFYWFEYVPYKGLIRVHDGIIQEADDIRRLYQERYDYYLRYADGLLIKQLETKSMDYKWYTYNAKQEIGNEEFLSQISELGYDKLIPCGCLYENISDAYENIGVQAHDKKALENFVNGKTGALDYVEEISDIPEDGFVMRSFEDFYNYITSGEEEWGSIEYVDFDNDGEDELIIRGYGNSCIFFDVIGDTVYRLLETTATTDVGQVVEIEGRRFIERTDLGHVGRQIYRIMKYDSCCCLMDWFTLSATYEEGSYSAGDEFWYRGSKVSMEEFESIRDSIVSIDHSMKEQVTFPVYGTGVAD